MPIGRDSSGQRPYTASTGTTSLTQEALLLKHETYAGCIPPPEQLGFKGGRFREWRKYQESAIGTSLDATTRLVIERLPTGAGKTAIYLAEALMVAAGGGRVGILTSTKGQQDQIIGSLPELVKDGTVVDVRGQTNYQCLAVCRGGELEWMNPNNRWIPVADGPCMDGASCTMRDGGCSYFDAIRRGQQGRIVVMNYAFWMVNPNMEPRWHIVSAGRPLDLLICDEAHEAVEEVCGFMGEEITEADVTTIEEILGGGIKEEGDENVEGWASWARVTHGIADRAMAAPPEVGGLGKKDRKAVKKVMRKLEKIAGMRKEEKGELVSWVVQWAETEYERAEYVVKFDPVWPTEYAERTLFRGSKKVIMSSATVQMIDAIKLGFREEEVTMFEAPSNFPVERRPIYRIPCMQMNYKVENKEGGEEKWCKMIERIVTDRTVVQTVQIDTTGISEQGQSQSQSPPTTGQKEGSITQTRQDRNGLVHTGSYKRRNLLRLWADRNKSSPLGRMMVSHSKSSYDVRDAVARLKSESGLLLVSPSVTTGYDFAFTMAEYQFIIKLPMPDTRAKVMKERCKQDEEFGPAIAAKLLMQMSGRIVRDEKDQGETFITDDNIRWFLKRNGHLLAEWWKEAYVDWEKTMAWAMGKLPVPPVKLSQTGLKQEK